MEGDYRVYYNKQDVGQVQVMRYGLYYRFLCRVKLQSESYLRLYAVCSQQAIDLGLCVPEQGYLTLSANRPTKYFIGSDYSFILEEKYCEQDLFLSDKRPFLRLKDLKYAHLSLVDGKPAASFKDE